MTKELYFLYPRVYNTLEDKLTTTNRQIIGTYKIIKLSDIEILNTFSLLYHFST